MTDVLNPEQRSRCMSNIRSKDTKPELFVRSFIHRMGYRFRLHGKDLPGKPDLVFPRFKKLIFIHGCFWHMHKCVYGKVKPATNVDFWESKRKSNTKRDRQVEHLLKKTGWKVLIIWECEIKNEIKLRSKIFKFFAS